MKHIKTDNEITGDYYEDDSNDWVLLLMAFALGLAFAIGVIEIIGPDKILNWFA